MNAIILAAGQGRRLSPYTDSCPKCLLPLDGKTFIEFQIDLLREGGVEEIGVVTGFCAEDVHRTCGSRIRYFHNTDFNSTNSLHSFLHAAPMAKNGCLVLNSDVIFHPDLLDLILSPKHENALLVDIRKGLDEEAMKVVCDEQMRVTAISKTIPPATASGENLGIIKLGQEAASKVIKVAETAAAEGRRNLWMPLGVAQVLGDTSFYALPIGDLPWIEVDFKDDLRRAQEEVYPLCTKNGVPRDAAEKMTG